MGYANLSGSGGGGGTGGGLTWNEETGTSVTAEAGNGYITSNAAQVVVTTPATAAVGDVIRIAGKGAGGWQIQLAGTQVLRVGDSVTTAGGTADSTNRYDCLEIVCITADSIWTTLSAVGNITLA